MSERILIIGNPRPTHLGGHLLRAAATTAHETQLLDVEAAYAGPRLLRQIWWHLLGRRPLHIARFGRQAEALCRAQHITQVLCTGFAPLSAAAINRLRATGARVVNFLTDDPWNPGSHAPWLHRALPHYQHIFTPRHANEEQLRALNGPSVSYLPFAYAAEEHFAPVPSDADETRWQSLVAFIGGADQERAEMIGALSDSGVPVGLWGGYWPQHPRFHAFAHGHTDADTFRRVVANAGANLCLVRRANRDGHSMRSYELPAIGGCLLVEDTPDHRRMFGSDGESVLYFSDRFDLLVQARRLLAMNPEERLQLKNRVRHRIMSQGNTYLDRLIEMITVASTLPPLYVQHA